MYDTNKAVQLLRVASCMMQIVMRLYPYRMGKNLLSKKNIYVYAITNHQNTCIFFSIIICFFRHTSWSHETGITSKELTFFKYYQIILSKSKQSFTIVYFLHTIISNVSSDSRIVQM